MYVDDRNLKQTRYIINRIYQRNACVACSFHKRYSVFRVACMIDVITRLLMRIRHVYRYTLTDTEGVATPPSNTERCVRRYASLT